MRKRRESLRIVHLIVFFQTLLLLSACWLTGPGWDEWAHLPSGIYHVQHADMRPYCVNPPLIRMLAAIPVCVFGQGLEYEDLYTEQGFRVEFFLALKLVQSYGEDSFFWMSVARTFLIPIALFGTYLIAAIGHRMSGKACALASAMLWAFSPIVLAFGSAVTPDVGATVFGLWASWRFSLWLRVGSWKTVIGLGVSLALAVLSKSTWLLLPPFVILWTLVYCIRHRRRISCRKRSTQIVVAFALMWMLVNSIYNFEGWKAKWRGNR